jgi:hypothetical protein
MYLHKFAYTEKNVVLKISIIIQIIKIKDALWVFNKRLC